MITSIEELAFLVQQWQHKMTAEQRVQFWSVIQMNYCPHCGDETATEGNQCPCERDE